LFGALICLLSAYLMYKCGVSIVPIAAIFAVLAGMSPVTAGCGIGCGLWLAQVISERLEWLSVLNRWDMGWVALIALFVVIQDFTGVRALLGRMTYRGARAWCWITARLTIAMVLVGIVLLAAQRAGVLSIPDILARAHLIRTGIGIYAAQAIYNYRNGVLNGAYE
jgi:hypothetical protein